MTHRTLLGAVASLALIGSACGPFTAADGLRPAPIAWVHGNVGTQHALCPAFESIAGDGTTWWISGPGCLLRASDDPANNAIFPFSEGEWSMDRVDALLAAGDAGVWAAGRQRNGDTVRAVLGRFTAAGPAVGATSRWAPDGALIQAFARAQDGVPWAVGRMLGSEPGLLIAQWDARRWQPVDTAKLTRGELYDVDFSPDGCAWMVGRDGGGEGLLLHYDGRKLRRRPLEARDGVPRRVAAASCGDVWIAGTSAVRYAHGHREEIAFGNAELSGIALCPDGDLLLVGERTAHEPEMRGRHVGFAFRVREGQATPMAVALPFVVGDWRLADVGCDAHGAWAVGSAVAQLGASQERRALLHQLGPGGWEFRGWEFAPR